VDNASGLDPAREARPGAGRAPFTMGFGFDPREHEIFTEVARAADAAGLAMVGTGDTPALLGDCYVGLTLLSQATSGCAVASWITNPVTRHPGVIASALSTVDTLCGHRLVCGMSSGDSGVYNLGCKAASIVQMEEVIGVLRELWTTGASTSGGKPVRLTWAERAIPIYLAPGGPKGLRLAGRLADGIVIETGVLPEVVDDALSHVRAGAAEADRTLDDIDIWWHVRATIAPSRQEAIHQLRSPLAGLANRSVRFGVEGKLIPDELIPKFEELHRRYSIAHHEEHGVKLRNGPLLEELGLLDYLVDRFSVAGTTADWIARVRELQGRGVRQLAISAMMEDKLGFIHALGSEVIPALSEIAQPTVNPASL
jgi:5,10-methylenetetrahydromethanopterin reductase